MKNYKRIVALAMAATMVAGNGAVVMAAEGGASGSGDYEGYVEEVSAFTVEVPTDASATAGFDFFVDPNNLLSQTKYARITNATEADFEAGTQLFFTRTPNASATPAIVKYGKDSDSITFTNKSSYDVDVEIQATVTGADGITLGAIADDTTEPTLNLAIVSGADTAAITADGGKLTGTIGGADDNFEIQWNGTENKYEYAQIATPDTSKWQTYSFNLTGACGGTWTAAQAEVEPTVNLVWKVTDPKATPVDDFAITAAADGSASYTFGVKPTGDLTKLMVGGSDRSGAITAGNVTYDAATGKLTFNSTATKNILGDGATAVVTIGGTEYTLTYTKE